MLHVWCTMIMEEKILLPEPVEGLAVSRRWSIQISPCVGRPPNHELYTRRNGLCLYLWAYSALISAKVAPWIFFLTRKVFCWTDHSLTMLYLWNQRTVNNCRIHSAKLKTQLIELLQKKYTKFILRRSGAWSPSEDDPPGARVVFARPWGGAVLKLSV